MQSGLRGYGIPEPRTPINIFENNLQDVFKIQAGRIMENTTGIGWGFNETMTEIYYEYYSDDTEQQ